MMSKSFEWVNNNNSNNNYNNNNNNNDDDNDNDNNRNIKRQWIILYLDVRS